MESQSPTKYQRNLRGEGVAKYAAQEAAVGKANFDSAEGQSGPAGLRMHKRPMKGLSDEAPALSLEPPPSEQGSGNVLAAPVAPASKRPAPQQAVGSCPKPSASAAVGQAAEPAAQEQEQTVAAAAAAAADESAAIAPVAAPGFSLSSLSSGSSELEVERPAPSSPRPLFPFGPFHPHPTLCVELEQEVKEAMEAEESPDPLAWWLTARSAVLFVLANQQRYRDALGFVRQLELCVALRCIAAWTERFRGMRVLARKLADIEVYINGLYHLHTDTAGEPEEAAAELRFQLQQQLVRAHKLMVAIGKKLPKGAAQAAGQRLPSPDLDQVVLYGQP